MKLGGSALAQVLNKLGNEVPTVKDSEYFADAFNAVQNAIEKGLVLAGHDISAGGMITALLEMCFANVEGGLEVNLDKLSEQDIVKILFAENPGILVQVKDKKAFEKLMEEAGVGLPLLPSPLPNATFWFPKKASSTISASTICVTYGTNLLINWISSRAVTYAQATASRTTKCNRWNSSIRRISPVSCLLTA